MRERLPPLAALDSLTLIGLADDGDVGLSVTTSVVRSAGGSGSDGDKSGNDELEKTIMIKRIQLGFQSYCRLTSFMVGVVSSVEDQLILWNSFAVQFICVHWMQSLKLERR